jgi:hypothetical protein
VGIGGKRLVLDDGSVNLLSYLTISRIFFLLVRGDGSLAAVGFICFRIVGLWILLLCGIRLEMYSLLKLRMSLPLLQETLAISYRKDLIVARDVLR